MKRVVHLFSGDLWAGAEVMTFNLLSKLKTFPDLDIIAVSLNEGMLTERLRQVGIETHVIPENENSFPKVFYKLLRLLKRRHIDIIHSHRYKENLLALLLSKPLGIQKLLTTTHGMPELPVSGAAENGSASWKCALDFAVLKIFFTCTVAVSRDIEKKLINEHGFLEKKVKVIHNGIDIKAAILSENIQPKGSRFHIGTVGRMVPVKGFDLFIEIASEIKKRLGDVRFSILGDGPLKDALVQKAKNLSIENDIEFLSPISDPYPYYRSLDLYLNTSVHEGIPLSVLEAMSCGVPVVAPAVGGLPEIITSSSQGKLIAQRQPENFVNACIELLNESLLRVSMGQEGSKRVAEFFSVEAMSDNYYKLYSHLA